MKPLKFAIPALILATAGAAGAQSVSTEGGVSVDTEATAGASTGVDAEVTAQSDAETGTATGDAAAKGGLTVAAEAGGEAGVELSEGTDIVARDGVTIGAVADVVDEAQGLVRIELDEAIEADIPAVVLSTESMTAVDGEVQVPMTGAEFTAAVAQLAEQNGTMTN